MVRQNETPVPKRRQKMSEENKSLVASLADKYEMKREIKFAMKHDINDDMSE